MTTPLDSFLETWIKTQIEVYPDTWVYAPSPICPHFCLSVTLIHWAYCLRCTGHMLAGDLRMEVLALWLHWRKGPCKGCALTAKELSVTCCLGKRKHYERILHCMEVGKEADYFPSSCSVLTRTKLSQAWRLWVAVQRVYCDDSSILWTAHFSVLINYCLLWNPIFVFLRVHLGLEIIRASCLPLLMPRSVPWWQFCFILK